MREKTCEDGSHDVSAIEAKRVPFPPHKEGVSGNVVCMTLEKGDEYSKGKSKEGGIKHQEKCVYFY